MLSTTGVIAVLVPKSPMETAALNANAPRADGPKPGYGPMDDTGSSGTSASSSSSSSNGSSPNIKYCGVCGGGGGVGGGGGGLVPNITVTFETDFNSSSPLPMYLAEAWIDGFLVTNGTQVVLAQYHPYPIQAVILNRSYSFYEWLTQNQSFWNGFGSYPTIANNLSGSTTITPGGNMTLDLVVVSNEPHNWGGFVESVPTTTRVNQVTGAFTMPTKVAFNTTASHGYPQAAAYWVGIGGENGNKSLFQAGVQFSYSPACNNATPRMNACANMWYEVADPLCTHSNGCSEACSTVTGPCFFDPNGGASPNYFYQTFNLLNKYNGTYIPGGFPNNHYVEIVLQVLYNTGSGCPNSGGPCEKAYFSFWVDGNELWGTGYNGGPSYVPLGENERQYPAYAAGPDQSTAEWILEALPNDSSPILTGAYFFYPVISGVGYSSAFNWFLEGMEPVIGVDSTPRDTAILPIQNAYMTLNYAFSPNYS
jgi:hypothetical protein